MSSLFNFTNVYSEVWPQIDGVPQFSQIIQNNSDFEEVIPDNIYSEVWPQIGDAPQFSAVAQNPDYNRP